MKKLCTLIILALFSLNAFAQVNANHYLPHNGGNGGDDDEIMIKNTLLQIGTFLDSSDGEALFGKEVDAKKFLETVKKVDIRVVEDDLTDKFNLKRCALNFPEEMLVVFNRSCLDKLRNNVNDLYVLLTHEILNIMGLELPDERGGSIYPISTKIGAVGPLVIAKAKHIIFSSDCNLKVRDWFSNSSWSKNKMLKKILKDKGYQEITSDWGIESEQNNLLDMKLMSKKTHLYTIKNNILTLENGERIQIESSFINNKFDGFIVLKMAGKTVYLPTPVKTSNVGNGQVDVTPKGFWRESLIEGFMQLPSCVKY